MTALYADTAEPVLIQGYATCFHETSCTDPPLRFLPGCFMLNGQSVSALFEHEPGQRFGHTRDRTLRLFQDAFGLGFELDAPATWNSLGLLKSITAGHFRECSIALNLGPTVLFRSDRRR